MGDHSRFGNSRVAIKLNTLTFLLLEPVSLVCIHTPSIAFMHLPKKKKRKKKKAKFGYATEGALDLYIRAAVHRRGQRPPKGLGTDKTVEATKRPDTHVNTRRIHPG